MKIIVFFLLLLFKSQCHFYKKSVRFFLLVLLFKGEKLVGISVVAWKPPEQHAGLSFSQQQIP